VQAINVNTANSEELQLAPGIGPVTAGRILQMRKSYGSLVSVDDLLAIRGLGPKRLDKMRKYLTIGKAGRNPRHQRRRLQRSILPQSHHRRNVRRSSSSSS